MTDFHGDQSYPNNFMNRALRRVGKRVQTAAECKQLRDERNSINGRMGPEKFETYAKNAPKSFGAALFTLIFLNIIRVPFFRLDRGSSSISTITLFGIFSAETYFIPAIRRLHDVGESGLWLLKPWTGLKLLKLPSGPPNKWGDGPT